VCCAEAQKAFGTGVTCSSGIYAIDYELSGAVALGTDQLGLDGPGKVDGAISLSQNSNVLGFRLAGLAILADIVADLLTVGQSAAEADTRDVNEDVWAAVVWGDEAEPLILCKKFYCTGCHNVLVC